MEDDPKTLKDESEEPRREFLRKVGKAAVTAPAVALLLSAEAKRAGAVNGGMYNTAMD